jgi:DNA uptake protein ComE-like DNA-binding protein
VDAIQPQVIAIALLVALGSACSLFQHGRHAGSSQATRLDLNTASRGQLGKLSGLSGSDVDRIVAGRPYAKKREVVDRGILDQKKFTAIHDDIGVVQGRTGAR